MGYSGQNLPEEALEQLHEALRLDPRHAPSLFWAGALSLQGGRPAEALALLRRLQDVDPGNAQGYLLAGQAALNLNQPRDALAYLERAIALEPANQEFRAVLNRARQAAASAP
jgi:tetratricopeptide (TPR) repeat protein